MGSVCLICGALDGACGKTELTLPAVDLREAVVATRTSEQNARMLRVTTARRKRQAKIVSLRA